MSRGPISHKITMLSVLTRLWKENWASLLRLFAQICIRQHWVFFSGLIHSPTVMFFVCFLQAVFVVTKSNGKCNCFYLGQGLKTLKSKTVQCKPSIKRIYRWTIPLFFSFLFLLQEAEFTGRILNVQMLKMRRSNKVPSQPSRGTNRYQYISKKTRQICSCLIYRSLH